MNQYSFGTINLESLLSANSEIKLTLIDSAIKRPVSGKYSYTIRNSKIIIKPLKKFQKSLVLNKEIELTPKLISFIGLYLGDGNKTGNIGFSQREINILKFAHDVEISHFGDSFENKWSILEDTRRFETPLMEKKLNLIGEELSKQKSFEKTALELAAAREFLIREFLTKAKEVNLQVDRNEINQPVVSPLKGAQSAGKSSLEYIQDLYGSHPFLPLWLKIVYDVVDCIIEGCNKDWIKWTTKPREALSVLNVVKYVSTIKYQTGSTLNGYTVSTTLSDPDFVEISKRGRTTISVSRELPLSPLLFLVSGLYLAEGDTKKENIFLMGKKRVPLNVALTSSEERILRAFVEVLEKIGQNLLNRWKVKVGSKYYVETEEIAQKFGVITLRGGEKGQGYVRTQELHDAARLWALNFFPFLKDYSDSYSNLEITGVGIPRVHIMAKSTLDAYFISLVRDAVFRIEELLVYSKRIQ